MVQDWIECTLADTCSSIDYGYTASAVDSAVGPKFLRITDIVSGHIDWGAVPYVSADEKTLEKYQLHNGDIVIARTGASTGASSYVHQPPVAVFASYLVRLKIKPEFDSRYLAYYLKSDAFWSYIRGVLGDKSAQPNASASTMTRAPIKLPRDKAEQREIAHILGTLDDKIQLNRRMNATLEAIARAIFKSWFVDFDPVHAKARGEQPYGMDAETAALFPDAFDDSELGPIPAGWGVKTVGDIGDVITGKTPPSTVSDYYGGSIPFIRIPDMHNQVFVMSTEKTLTRSGSQTQRSKLLPPLSVCVSCIATPGVVSLTAVPSHANQQINAIVCAEETSPYFIYFSMKNLYDVIIAAASGGSATLNLNKSDFSKLVVVLPPSRLMREFHRFVAPYFSAILLNQRQILVIAELRDALLPRLISGEIRVGDIESEFTA